MKAASIDNKDNDFGSFDEPRSVSPQKAENDKQEAAWTGFGDEKGEAIVEKD